MRIMILCNNPIAVPGIREMAFHHQLVAIGVPKKNREMRHIFGGMFDADQMPVVLLEKNTFVDELKQALDAFQPEVVLLMTFPFIIPGELLGIPEKGFLNFHYGLLPQYRGPQPILWHLLNNEPFAGITVHLLDEGIDTGKIVLQQRIPIEAGDTYGLVQSKLAFLGAGMCLNLVKILEYGKVIPAHQQDETKAAYYEMPGPQHLTIDWHAMTAAQIVRLANACNPWNKGAATKIGDWVMGLTFASVKGACQDQQAVPGTVLTCDELAGLTVKTADGQLVKLDIVYLNEGYFPGHRLAEFGIREGMVFA